MVIDFLKFDEQFGFQIELNRLKKDDHLQELKAGLPPNVVPVFGVGAEGDPKDPNPVGCCCCCCCCC